MKKIVNRITARYRKLESQAGFTLIELLVVVGILAVLAGIAIPNVVGFINQGSEESANAELQAVQTAVDLYIVSIGSIAAKTAGNNMAAVPALYPTYMRTEFTRCDFAWDVNGQVTRSGAEAGCS